jgi:hypothetical protein
LGWSHDVEVVEVAKRIIAQFRYATAKWRGGLPPWLSQKRICLMDIKPVTITVARPRGNFHGKVETGWYTVNDGTVVLVEQNGVAIDRYKLTRKLRPGQDAHDIACLLMRQRYSKGSGDFTRPLNYPKLVY